MSATNKLLDKYAQTCYATKDKEIAARLRVTKQAVSGWRNGHAHPDADSVEKMAVAIGEPVGPWLAQIEAERARTPANRQVWLRLAAALGTTFAIALTATPTVTHAAGTLPIVSNYAWDEYGSVNIGDLPRAVYDRQYRATIIAAATTVDTGILGRRSHSGFRC